MASSTRTTEQAVPTTVDRPHRAFLAHFSRVTTSGSFIPEVDGLRFVAILAVIVFHLAINLEARNPIGYALPGRGDPLTATLTSGQLGVQLFFVVSGLVLALPFARHHLLGAPRVRLRSYFLRRVTRLEPPYVVALLGCFLLLVVVHGRSPGFLAPHLLASLAYLHVPIYGHDSLINNVAWSLEVEIQFYVLVPLLSVLFAVRRPGARRAVLLAAILVTSAVGPLVAGTSPHLHNTLVRFVQYFLIGFLLADLMITGGLRPARRRLGWDVLALATVPLVIMLYTDTGLARRLPGDVHQLVAEVAIPWLFLVAFVGVFRGLALNALLTLPVITTVGGMCYSIYLLHNVLQDNGLRLTSGLVPTGVYALDLVLQLAFWLPLSVLVAGVFFVLVERPCMDRRWPQHLAGRVRSHAGRHRAPDLTTRDAGAARTPGDRR